MVAARVTSLLLALAVTVGWHVLAHVGPRRMWPPPSALGDVSWPVWVDLWTLAYAAVLVLPAPRASGLVTGRIREHRRGVLLVCGVPIVVTAVVYPLLPSRPWSADAWSMWAIGPAAEDLAIWGCGYRVLERGWSGSGRVVARVPVEWPLFWTAVVFTLHHVPNFWAMDAGDVAFQLVYVFVGASFIGLARQWTGSLLYGWIVHTTCNWIAWAVP